MFNLQFGIIFIIGLAFDVIFFHFYIISTIIMLIISIVVGVFLSKIQYFRFILYIALFIINIYMIYTNEHYDVFYKTSLTNWSNILLFVFFLIIKSALNSIKQSYRAYENNLYHYYVLANATFLYLLLALKFHFIYTILDYLILLISIIFSVKNVLNYNSNIFNIEKYTEQFKDQNIEKKKLKISLLTKIAKQCKVADIINVGIIENYIKEYGEYDEKLKEQLLKTYYLSLENDKSIEEILNDLKLEQSEAVEILEKIKTIILIKPDNEEKLNLLIDMATKLNLSSEINSLKNEFEFLYNKNRKE